jgi:hypothetical protein
MLVTAPNSVWTRTPRENVRDALALLALIVGVCLCSWAFLASQMDFAGLRWTATWSTLGATGVTLLVIGAGLWLAHRLAPYALAALGFGAASAALVVASGLTVRSVRLALGGPVLPMLIAVFAVTIGLAASWLARRGGASSLRPMTGVGAVLIGIVGGITSAVLLLTLMRLVGLTILPMAAVGTFVIAAAVVFGIMLAYGAHRVATDGAKWPAGLAFVVLAVPIMATQLSPVLLAGSPAWPYLLDGHGGTRPLVETIPAEERGGARLEVTAVATDVMLGIEGFVTFVKATRDGQVVLDQRVPEGGLSHSLPAGDYELDGYYRNCDGWCGLLDPPGPVCSVSAQLDGDRAYDLTITVRDRSCVLK